MRLHVYFLCAIVAGCSTIPPGWRSTSANVGTTIRGAIIPSSLTARPKTIVSTVDTHITVHGMRTVHAGKQARIMYNTDGAPFICVEGEPKCWRVWQNWHPRSGIVQDAPEDGR